MILVVFFKQRYLGAGMDVVEAALYQEVFPYDFS